MICLRFLASFVLLFLSAAEVRAQQPGEPGKFDFYVLALSWSPSFCEASEESSGGGEQCRQGRPYAFVVHGLWPQYEKGFPRTCIAPAPWVPSALINDMLDLMPARGLIIQQWRAHGTCSGLTPREYFETVRKARERVRIPERFERISDYTTVTPSEVEEAFVAANAGLSREMIAVTCDRRRLREVRVCMSRDLRFRPCPEIDRRSCRLPQVLMPPVRG